MRAQMTALSLQELCSKYANSVPRYTSYPTAICFSETQNTKTYQEHLKALTSEEEISIYIHIPFCYELCWFCGCNTKIIKKYTPVKAYVEHLLKEIDLVSQNLENRLSVKHIHFGGGSPSILEIKDFQQIMSSLRKYFSISNDAEIAIEIEPRSAKEDVLSAYFLEGINRVSIGIQDFNPQVQKAINRLQSFEQSKSLIDFLRKNGIQGINIDLMYGLPFQTEKSIKESTELALSLKADRFSLFAYAHLPQRIPHQRMIKDETLANAFERIELYQVCFDTLTKNGFVAIGLDHFARPEDSLAQALEGKQIHRNFQGYTTDKASNLIGFGASAIGQLHNAFFQNHTKQKDYFEVITSGDLATKKGYVMTEQDKIYGAIIEELMCYMEVDLKSICNRYNLCMDKFSMELDTLKEMEDDGIIKVNEGHIVIHPSKRFLLRTVCTVFDQYFQTHQRKYSQSI
jgi:oxygen-independent coproporphyrinogen-3 oxidase